MKKICPLCGTKTTEIHFVEMNCDGRPFYGIELCRNCTRNFMAKLPFVKEALDKAGSPCPNCGIYYDEIVKDGKVGCAECYEHFSDQFDALHTKLHQHEEHVGKNSSTQKLKDLQLRLAHAKEHGKFEEAAQLVNQICRLKNESGR